MITPEISSPLLANQKLLVHGLTYLFIPGSNTHYSLLPRNFCKNKPGTSAGLGLLKSEQIRTHLLNGKLPLLARIAAHPTRTNFAMIGEQPGIARVSCPPGLAPLFTVKAGLDT